jgi:hypothetical protein
MVLEHGDHIVDIFDSGKALALALPDLLGVAAALGDCDSWISMANNNTNRYLVAILEDLARRALDELGLEGTGGGLTEIVHVKHGDHYRIEGTT